MKTKRTLFTIFLAVLAATAMAQAAPVLTGDWKLNVAKSNYGSFPAPQGATRKIIQSGVKLSMTTVQKGAQGEVTTQLNYTTDGKEAVNKTQTGDFEGVGAMDRR